MWTGFVSVQARFCLIKLDEDEEEEECCDPGQFRVNRGIPPNGNVKVLIHVYIVSVSSYLVWACIMLYRIVL